MVNIEIKDKKENKLIGRLEIQGRLTFTGATPSNNVVKAKLAADLNKDQELVIIKSIYSRYSHQEADFLVFIYDSKEAMDKTEVMTKHLRKKAEAEKKSEDAKKEEKKAPVEEKKEEAKPAEEKKESEKPKKEAAPEEKKETKEEGK